MAAKSYNQEVYFAARSGDVVALQDLLRRFCPNGFTNDSTPLHVASYYGHLDAVTALLAAGARTDAINSYGLTPIQEAKTAEIKQALSAPPPTPAPAPPPEVEWKGFADANVPLRKGGKRVVRVIHISDTHCRFDPGAVPPGDILIHSGDFTNRGAKEEIALFQDFLSRLPHRHKVLICGNHEIGLDKWSPEQIQGLFPGCVYLQDSEVTVEGIRIYGTPWTTIWQAFHGEDHEGSLGARFQHIPRDLDILVSHTPPFAVMDKAWVERTGQTGKCGVCGKLHPHFEHWGSQCLMKRVQEVAPKLHLFGHVHDDIGILNGAAVGCPGTTFVNSAVDIKHKCHVIDCFL